MLKAGFADCMRGEIKCSEINRPNGSGDYLFLYFPYPMKHFIGKESFISEKNACVLYAPTDPHRFCGAPTFMNSFVHFTATAGEASGIPTGKIFYPECFEELNRITGEIKNETLLRGARYEEMTDALLKRLLILLDRSLSPAALDAKREEFERLRFEVLSNISDNISIDALAQKMCVSRSQFYDAYKGYFGISPKKDILRARMEKAAVLLTNKAKTVAEIASEVGFASTEHFIRYYKSYFGRTPRR